MVPTGSSSSSPPPLSFPAPCGCVYVWRYPWMQRIRKSASKVPSACSSCFWDRVSCWNLGRLIRTSCLVEESVGSICVCLSSPGLADRCMTCCPAFYTGIGLVIRSSFLGRKHSTGWSVSPVWTPSSFLASCRPLLTPFAYTWAWPRRGWNSLPQ